MGQFIYTAVYSNSMTADSRFNIQGRRQGLKKDAKIEAQQIVKSKSTYLAYEACRIPGN